MAEGKPRLPKRSPALPGPQFAPKRGRRAPISVETSPITLELLEQLREGLISH